MLAAETTLTRIAETAHTKHTEAKSIGRRKRRTPPPRLQAVQQRGLASTAVPQYHQRRHRVVPMFPAVQLSAELEDGSGWLWRLKHLDGPPQSAQHFSRVKGSGENKVAGKAVDVADVGKGGQGLQDGTPTCGFEIGVCHTPAPNMRHHHPT